ncbi:MAG: site-specific integrase [Armatimonadota bacterium]
MSNVLHIAPSVLPEAHVELSLEASVSCFLEHCRARNLSEATSHVYQRRLLAMVAWLREACGIIAVGQVSAAHLHAYLDHRRGEGCLRRDGSGRPSEPPNVLSPTTLRAHIVTVRGLWNWLVAEGLASESPAAAVPKPRVPNKVIPALSEAEARSPLSQPDKRTFFGLRDHAALVLMLGTGVRVSEALTLRLTDIDLPAHKLKG